MTTRKPRLIKLLGMLLAGLMLSSSAMAAQRARSFDEARRKAGNDGIIVYWYGPDWNKRSVRMLQSFWRNPATEEAAGNAVMFAAALYQDETAAGAEESSRNCKGAPAPPFQVCPTVIMMDAQGQVYATLTGTDYLGDESGELGAKNIADRLGKLRRRQELVEKARGLSGKDKARLLHEAVFIGIEPDAQLLRMVQETDPEDKLGTMRAWNHSQIKFTYKQIKADDLGFTNPDDTIDMAEVRRACMEIINDEAYRTEDRQAAYNVLIGLSHRQGEAVGKTRALIRRGMNIDKESWYGRLSPELQKLWGKSDGRARPKGPTRLEERRRRMEQSQKKHGTRHVEID